MRAARVNTVGLAAALALGGCAQLDSFSGRVSTINENIASADVDNVVRNVVRASRTEPLSFVAVTKVTGSRAGDLKIGIPNLILGPGRVPSQRQYVFGGNLADNSQAYSVELAQLRSDTFTKGLMNPVAASQIENFSNQGFSRELLFYLFVDSLTVELVPSKGAASYARFRLRNDPLADDPAKCAPAPAGDPDKYLLSAKLVDERVIERCPFHVYQKLADMALAYGVTVRTPQPAAPGAPPMEAGFCFEPSLDMQMESAVPPEFLCSATTPREHLEMVLGKEGEQVRARVTVNLRSPYAMFEYLGHVLRLPDALQPRLARGGLAAAGSDRRLFPLERRTGADCFAGLRHDGVSYCLPDNAYDAKSAVRLLILLLQINTNRSDLPTSAVAVSF